VTFVCEKRKDYIANDEFFRYLRIFLGSKRISRKQFNEKKVQEVLTQLDKLEASHLVFNQILKVIKCFIAPRLSYVVTNRYIQGGQIDLIDKKIRRIINNFLEGQKIQKNMFYVSPKVGGLDIPCLRDEKNMYRIHH
jgi:hypothetical protein